MSEHGQNLYCLADVAVDRRDSDAEPGGELGVGVAAAQVGQDQQGLAARSDASPSGADLATASSQVLSEVTQVRAGQIDRRWVDKHTKLLVGAGDLGREPVYQELRQFVQPTNRLSTQSGWKRLMGQAGSLCARDLMTSPAVTVSPDALLPQAARLMATHRIKRLPVVDMGTLAGIVSRSDLLKVFLRPDSELADDIRHQVVGRLFPLPSAKVRVDVTDGVVTLSGEVHDGSLMPVAARLTQGIEGIVDVRCELTAAESS